MIIVVNALPTSTDCNRAVPFRFYDINTHHPSEELSSLKHNYDRIADAGTRWGWLNVPIFKINNNIKCSV